MFQPDNEWIVRIHAQFMQNAEVQRRVSFGVDPLDVPSADVLAELVDVAFWASLTTNEGRPTRVRIVAVPAHSADQVLAFKHAIPFTEEEVANLAPAAWSTGWLAVDVKCRPLGIWGVSRNPTYDHSGAITIDVTDPGVIRVGLGPLQSFVVFAGREVASPHGAGDLTLAARLQNALGKRMSSDPDTALRECQALGVLARMVLEDRHGGTVLVVPDGSSDWRDSLNPFTHEFMQADSSVRDSIAAMQRRQVALLDQSRVSEDLRDAMFSALSRAHWHPEDALRPVARLAAVDGAVVLTSDLNVLGFGAMISVECVPDVYLVRAWAQQVDRIPIEEAGGTRHQSAIRFVGENHAAIGLVVSHDGHLSLAHWSSEHDGVVLMKNAEWWI